MNEHDYLWDRSGPPDPEIERLEQTLSAFRMRERPLDLARAAQPRRLSLRAWRIGFAFAACCVVLLGVLGWYAYQRTRNGWQFVASSGTAQVDGKSIRTGVLRVGQSLENPAETVLRLRVGDIGDVELSGAARVQLLESREGRQRLALRYGTIHARISAPPAVFVVDTPGARAIDLGCEYTLTAAENGAGQLHVDFGWVQLQYGWRQSLVPQGAEARIAPGGRITPAYFPDATAAFRAALVRYSLEENLGEAERGRLLADILRDARVRDSLTLLNLFRLATPKERALIFDRLNALVPAPAEVDREGVIAGHLGSSNAWWAPVHRALDLQQIKKKGPLNLGTYPGSE